MSTGKAPAFQFYPKDFLSDEEQALMSLAQVGAYIRLMCRCWLTGSLPAEPDGLARLCGATSRQMRAFWPSIAHCFVQREDGRWIHPRLEKEREKQALFRARAAKGGEARHAPHKQLVSTPVSTAQADDKHGLSTHLAELDISLTSALLSPISYLQSADCSQHVPSTLVARRRLEAAWEGPKGLYVPQRKHSDFIQLRNHPDAERELFLWYQEVADTWTGSPGADMFRFWTARFEEKWPPTKASKARPAWLQTAKATP